MSMGDAVLQVIPLALGVAASPLPVVAIIVILLTKRARSSSLIFSAAWIVGNFVAISFAVAFAGQGGAADGGFRPSVRGLHHVPPRYGAARDGVAVTPGTPSVGRPRCSAPSWVHSVDNLSPWGGALVAFSNATTSPKNLALALAAGAVIQVSTPRPASVLVSELLYVAVASITIVGPVVVYFVGGERSTEILLRWKQKITDNAAAAMEMILFVLGAALAVRGLVNLLGVDWTSRRPGDRPDLAGVG